MAALATRTTKAVTASRCARERPSSARRSWPTTRRNSATRACIKESGALWLVCPQPSCLVRLSDGDPHEESSARRASALRRTISATPAHAQLRPASPLRPCIVEKNSATSAARRRDGLPARRPWLRPLPVWALRPGEIANLMPSLRPQPCGTREVARSTPERAPAPRTRLIATVNGGRASRTSIGRFEVTKCVRPGSPGIVPIRSGQGRRRRSCIRLRRGDEDLKRCETCLAYRVFPGAGAPAGAAAGPGRTRSQPGNGVLPT